MNETYYQELAEKWLNGTISAREKQLFTQWYDQKNEQIQFMIPDSVASSEQLHEEQLWSKIRATMQPLAAVAEPSIRWRSKATIIRFRYAAAILLIAGVSTFLYLQHPPPKSLVHQPPMAPADREPASNRAVLTLADGSTIVLDSAMNGLVARQGATHIIQLKNGSLAYTPGPQTGPELLNTVSTPSGGQYQVVLPDGSRAWLNAASSITFPAVFSGHERKVTIRGEVYFEIMQDKRKPFFVEAPYTHVEVLGTSFNINAYPDEPAVKTSLITGMVQIKTANTVKVLKPGQQASGDNYHLGIKNDIDTAQVIAWKNGLFNFDNRSFGEIMRQLSRWYNITILYKNEIPRKHFGGKMGSNVQLSSIVAFLNKADIACSIANGGKTLIIGQ